MVRRDQRWLRRKVDLSAVASVLFLAAPGVAGVIVCWDWDNAWKWPVIVVCVAWVTLIAVGGGTQLLIESADDEAAQEVNDPIRADSADGRG